MVWEKQQSLTKCFCVLVCLLVRFCFCFSGTQLEGHEDVQNNYFFKKVYRFAMVSISFLMAYSHYLFQVPETDIKTNCSQGQAHHHRGWGSKQKTNWSALFGLWVLAAHRDQHCCRVTESRHEKGQKHLLFGSPVPQSPRAPESPDEGRRQRRAAIKASRTRHRKEPEY